MLESSAALPFSLSCLLLPNRTPSPTYLPTYLTVQTGTMYTLPAASASVPSCLALQYHPKQVHDNAMKPPSCPWIGFPKDLILDLSISLLLLGIPVKPGGQGTCPNCGKDGKELWETIKRVGPRSQLSNFFPSTSLTSVFLS
ncbi:hypothetical protein LY76DRAFT_358551 [Colletotrichum caudatum]|nr:hypothetical protein LY76DRAFT_358551 [Colletotrichum caudatum]